MQGEILSFPNVGELSDSQFSERLRNWAKPRNHWMIFVLLPVQDSALEVGSSIEPSELRRSMLGSDVDWRGVGSGSEFRNNQKNTQSS